jgi:signal transduction histidine kinase
MLVDGTMRPERVEHAATAIARSAESLRQLIDDLMDRSQLASGRMRLSIGAVDVKDVAQDVIDTVRLSAENKGVVLTNAVESDLP